MRKTQPRLDGKRPAKRIKHATVCFGIMFFAIFMPSVNLFAQGAPAAPAISYSSPQTYTVGAAITSLSPVNTGGTVAAPGYSTLPTFISFGPALQYFVAVDNAGNVYTTGADATAVTKFPAGNYGATTTIGSGFSNPAGIAIDAAGDIYVADAGNNVVKEIPAGSNTPVVIATGFNNPQGVAVDVVGDVYVADNGSGTVYEIPVIGGSPQGLYTLHTGLGAIEGIAIDAGFNIYVTNPANTSVTEFLAGQGSTHVAVGSGLQSPYAVAVDASGNVFVDDNTGDQDLKEIPAGNGTPINIGAGFSNPYGVALDAAGNIYVTSYFGEEVWEVKPVGGYYLSPGVPLGLSMNGATGVISGTPISITSAANYVVTAYNTSGSSSATVNINVLPFALSYASPQVYTAGVAITPLAPAGSGVANYGYNSKTTTLGSGFTTPVGVAADALGNLYVSDASTNLVKKIPAGNGAPVVIGTGFTSPGGIAVDESGNVYVADYGNSLVKEIPAGGGAIITLGSGFNNPSDVAVDAAGNVYVADRGNNAVKEIPVGGGAVITIGGSGFFLPTGVVADAYGNVYVADFGNGAIKEIRAGNGATITLNSGFSAPWGVTVDASGNVFLADQNNNAVDEIPAGSNTYISIGSGFKTPNGITVDPLGNVFVCNAGYSTVNEIQPAGGYFIGKTLPSGLSFSNFTGIISGTPTATSPAMNYTVTAYNSSGTASATVNIKVASGNASLAGLTPSNGALNPAFAGGTYSYKANVGNGLASITVTPTAADPTAAITVNGIAVTSGVPSQSLPLVVGPNTVTTIVTAQNGGTTKTYTLVVTEAKSSNANLSSFKPGTGSLSPIFSAATTSYTESVANSVTSITITPTTAVTTAAVTVNDMPVPSGTASAPIILNVGPNTITGMVTAQDGVTTKTYTLTVTRAPSSNAGLSNITLSKGTLTPAFVAGTTSYSDMVANSNPSVTLTPTTSDPNATVTVDGTAVISGRASGSIALAVGSNTITAIVTAQDGITKQTYTVTVIRPSTNAKLSGLKLSSGTLSPIFVSTTTSYIASVANAISAVTVTPTVSVIGATVAINGKAVTSGASPPSIPLAVGPNTITTIVTAQDGVTTDTYTVTVTRAAPSSNANLSNITLSKGALTPAFSSATTSYADMVANSNPSVTITPTTSDPNATVTINATASLSGKPSGAIALVVGSNTITIMVTAQDGITKQTYTVTVIRPSNNDKLSGLKLSTGTLSPIFVSTTTGYSASVANTVSSVTVTPAVSASTSTVAVEGMAVASGTASQSIALAVGANTISIEVTAQDGVTTETYTVTINRAAGAVNTVYQPVSFENPNNAPTLATDGIVVHQGISPNGDGINDFLQIDNISQYPDNRLSIMNRNGQLIYEAKGYDNSSKTFDGHSNKNGQMQLPGTYFYQLDYTVNGITKHKTGFLVLKY